MKLSRPLLGLLTLLLVIGALSVGVYLRLKPAGGEPASEAAANPGDSLVLPVEASEQFATDVPQPVVGVEVVRDTLWITVTAAGEAASVQGARVLSQVDGVVRRVPVQENHGVAGGDLLLEVDTTEYALALARARADLLNSQARYQEMTLFDDQITETAIREERARLARARSGLAQAEVALRQAELNLERTSIRAPFGGRVADLRVVEGQRVGPGVELMSVVSLDPIRVEVQVLERELGFLSEGRRAVVTFPAFPTETFTGRIRTINPLVDPNTRTGRVTIELPNPRGRIKPGMYARVSLEAQYFPDRILVPRSAILEKDRRTMLFVFENGRAKWRYVTTGLENDTQIEILENPETEMVQPGEIVLVDNHYYITHDAPVQLVESASGTGMGIGGGA